MCVCIVYTVPGRAVLPLLRSDPLEPGTNAPRLIFREYFNNNNIHGPSTTTPPPPVGMYVREVYTVRHTARVLCVDMSIYKRAYYNTLT